MYFKKQYMLFISFFLTGIMLICTSSILFYLSEIDLMADDLFGWINLIIFIMITRLQIPAIFFLAGISFIYTSIKIYI